MGCCLAKMVSYAKFLTVPAGFRHAIIDGIAGTRKRIAADASAD